MKRALDAVLSVFGGAWGAFWALAAGLVGVLVGVAAYTFLYAGGINYFGHEPETCVQCHAMTEQYEAWTKGSHKDAATCQDCHNPHDNFVAWLYSEADNGFWHSLKFTANSYPQNIKIREHNRQIVEDSCLHCHSSIVSEIQGTRSHGNEISCVQCHSNVGHLR